MLQIINTLINFLFPLECFGCGTEGTDLCESCILKLRPAKRSNFHWITSLGNYRDKQIQTLIWNIKRTPHSRLADILAILFRKLIANNPKDPDSWIFVSIPITRQRFRSRGFNQSELLGWSFSKTFGFPLITNVLYKTRNTKKQGTSKSKEERLQNLSGSFGVRNQHLIHNKNIILIDDVTTTGSTLLEARDTLLTAGANQILAWTIAN